LVEPELGQHKIHGTIVDLGTAEEVTMSIDASQLPCLVTVGTPGRATVTADHVCKLYFRVCCVIY